MKRCDLHLHTVQSASDEEFTYDKDVLQDYVTKTGLDVIAITNHNLFDCAQFREIKALLHQTVVLPGIEVDLENGHILVIANNDDNSLSDFNKKCRKVNNFIQNENHCIQYEKFIEIFGDLDKYLLIPHYKKDPKLGEDLIGKFGSHIIAGEVSSVKKFIYTMKEGELTPVFFSDFRVKQGVKPESYPVDHTFFDIDEVNINTLKLCLMDKTKVSLTSENGIKLFQIFPNGQMLSTGLNIVLGKRSTGKTFTLDAIAKRFEGRVKYIRQFDLINACRNDSEQFENDLKIRQESFAEEFLREFNAMVADVLKIHLDEDGANLRNYLTKVMALAEHSNTKDVYSNSKLFNERELKEQSNKDLKSLIDAVILLLDSKHYKSMINKHLPEVLLRKLLKEMIDEYRKGCITTSYIKVVNEIIRLVKDSLQVKSSSPRIPNVDLYQYLINEKKCEVFNQVASAIKKDRKISSEKTGNFTICVSTRPFENATDLKTVGLKQVSLVNAFSNYKNPVQYLESLKSAGVDSDRIYKLFVAIEYRILNSSGHLVSGGERAEFNFLQKINDAMLYDLLIIDEPESSFDNLFLNTEVNKFIKEMANSMPVVISTHNSTIGGSIHPDYILYAEKTTDSTGTHFNIYSGSPTAKCLMDVNGNKIENYVITLNSLEAGEEAYSERKGMYEKLKN